MTKSTKTTKPTKTVKPRSKRPAMAVIHAQAEQDTDTLAQSLDPQPLTQERADALIQSAYAGVSPEQLKQIKEELYSRFEFDTPYAKSYGREKLGTPGAFTLLREWYWTERMDVLERCHQANERNPLVKAAVSWTTRFVVGTGGTLTYKAAEVKQVLEEFVNDPQNAFQSSEREFCDALQVDGELFNRYFVNEQGRTAISPLRPWHIQWIQTNPENFREIESYHYVYISYSQQPGASALGTKDLTPAEVLHVAINKMPYEQRGRPDLFAILPWAKAYRDWLEERARLNRRKSIYYQVKLKNATTGQVAQYQGKFSKPPAPGSIIVTNDNVEWIVLESNIKAGEASEDGRQIKLMLLAGMQLPEYFFSDGANANLASATAQQLPALRKFADFQDILTDQVWKPIFKRVIANAVKAGLIQGEPVEDKDDDVWLDMVDGDGQPVFEGIKEVATQLVAYVVKDLQGNNLKEAFGHIVEFVKGGGKQKRIKASEAFDYAYPQLEEKDPYNLAKALQIAVNMEWASNETASSDMGFDPSKERKKIEAEAAARLEKAMKTPQGFNPDGTPIPPRDMATLAKANGNEPQVKQNGGSANGAGNSPDRVLPPSEATAQRN